MHSLSVTMMNGMDYEDPPEFEAPILTPGFTYLMDVTHIFNPEKFYTRLPSLRNFVDYVEVRGEPIRHDQIEVGSRVIYNSPTVGRYIRGSVQEISGVGEDKVCVMDTPDYGCLDSGIRVSDIYLPRPGRATAPKTALPCGLDGAHPIGQQYPQEAAVLMRDYVSIFPVDMTIKSIVEDKLLVDIKRNTRRQNLINELADNGFVRIENRQNRGNRVGLPNHI